VTVARPAVFERIEHIVVLMLENRSFDHMLGYPSLEGGRDDVDDLRPGMANEQGGRHLPFRSSGWVDAELGDQDRCAGAVLANPLRHGRARGK
jgi:phospholipase C